VLEELWLNLLSAATDGDAVCAAGDGRPASTSTGNLSKARLRHAQIPLRSPRSDSAGPTVSGQADTRSQLKDLDSTGLSSCDLSIARPSRRLSAEPRVACFFILPRRGLPGIVAARRKKEAHLAPHTKPSKVSSAMGSMARQVLDPLLV